MPYKSATPLEAQSSLWHVISSSLASITPNPTSSKGSADDPGNKEDETRKRADQDGMEVDGVTEESMMSEVDTEEKRWIAVDGYPRTLLGFSQSDSTSSYVGLSRYAIEVECIVRYGFGNGDDETIVMDLYRRFRPCGAIRGFVFAERFERCSITEVRVIFEDELSVRKALNFDHTRLTYYVGDSPRRLWVKRATYTSSEWIIVPEPKLLDLKNGADRLPNALSEYCQNHPDMQYLSDEDNLPISPLPPFVDLANLPSGHWPNVFSTRQSRVNRQPLKSQDETFNTSGYKANRD